MLGPVLAEKFERRHVDRHAGELHGRRGGHISTAKQCTRQIDPRQHSRQQPLKRGYIGGAIFEKFLVFALQPRTAAQDA